MNDRVYVVVESILVAVLFGLWQKSFLAGCFMFSFNSCLMFEFRTLLIWLRRP
jgi:hypothetical protein